MKQASYRRSRTACLLLLILFLLSVLDKNPEIPSADEIPYLGYTQTTSVPCIQDGLPIQKPILPVTKQQAIAHSASC